MSAPVAQTNPPAADREQITDPRIEAILSEIDGGRVLDVGCVQHDPMRRTDPDWLHQHLYREAEEVLGIDTAMDGIDTLRHAGYNVRYADGEQLAISGEFDTVVAGELIEHLSRPGDFLLAAKRRLADGGQLVLTTPNVWCFAYAKELASGAVSPNEEHTCWYDEATLTQLLERFGYEVRIEHIGPASEGITRRLYRAPIERLQRLGATQLLAVCEPRGDT